MELRHLQAFVKLASTLNFSSAANELCITQSTLSATIRQLEDFLGMELFSRNSHGVTITEAGEQLLPYATETLHQAENCVSRIHDLNNLKCGQLRIGLTHSFSLLLVEAIRRFNALYPGVTMSIHYKTLPELMEMLAAHELDFVLSYKPSATYPMIESHVIFEDSLSVVVSKDNPLASLESVNVEELQNYKLALPSKGMQARIVLDSLCKEKGFHLHPEVEFNLIMPIMRLVGNSNFVTVISTGAVQEQNIFKSIPLNAADNKIIGSYHLLKGSYRKKSAAEFLRILCENDMVKKYGMA